MVTLILGGARSGKSSYAQALGAGWPGRVVVVATALPLDPEMKLRIDEHRKRRPPHWITVEATRELPKPSSLSEAGGIILDCLTLWVSNRLLESGAGQELAAELSMELDGFVSEARSCGLELAMVSNEVGHGIVPDNALARNYRDLLGEINQRAAALADRVIYLVAGIPLVIKG